MKHMYDFVVSSGAETVWVGRERAKTYLRRTQLPITRHISRL